MRVKSLFAAALLSAAAWTNVRAANLVLHALPPAIPADGSSAARVRVSAYADGPTIGDLPVQISIQGPASLNASTIYLHFGTEAATPEPTQAAQDDVYVIAGLSSGTVTVTATAPQFAAASANLQILSTVADLDSDGVPDKHDNCLRKFNPEQSDFDEDGVGDACDPFVDSDSDGTPDAKDNCPMLANAQQADADRDGYGDACDNFPMDRMKD